jgi:hypothetical protein
MEGTSSWMRDEARVWRRVDIALRTGREEGAVDRCGSEESEKSHRAHREDQGKGYQVVI